MEQYQVVEVAEDFLRWSSQRRRVKAVLGLSSPIQLAVLSLVVQSFPEGLDEGEIGTRLAGIFESADLADSIRCLAERKLIWQGRAPGCWRPADQMVAAYDWFCF